MSRVDHMDVAAYALGVLDGQDMERFEEHLATCWACAAELETMVPVVGLLSDIDAESITVLEQTQSSPVLLDRTLVAMRTHRRRARVRQILATAAAVVVFGGLTGVMFSNLTAEDNPGPSIAGPTTVPFDPPTGNPGDPGDPGTGGNPQEGDQRNATDANTGVKGTFFLISKDFGTKVDFILGRLPGPRECRLVVVREDSSTEVLSSWSVPPGGYGTNSNPQQLALSATTATKLEDVKHFQVEEIDEKGTASTLLTVPAS